VAFLARLAAGSHIGLRVGSRVGSQTDFLLAIRADMRLLIVVRFWIGIGFEM
jgi:hypothetical protein